MSDLRGLLQRIVPALQHAGVPFMVAGTRPVRIARFSEQEFEPRSPMTLLGVEVSMASAEDTIIAKLECSKAGGGSERQRRDVAGMRATVGVDLDYAFIERWLNGLDHSDEWELAKKTQVA